MYPRGLKNKSRFERYGIVCHVFDHIYYLKPKAVDPWRAPPTVMEGAFLPENFPACGIITGSN